MSRPPTIIDVAARAGVSKSLVSMVLRGDPGVSARRREAVLDAVHDLGYRPNRAAAILAGHRSRTIGVVIDDFRNPWYIPLLDGAGQVLAQEGLKMTVADSASNKRLGADPFDDLVSLRVDGIILAGEPRPGTVVPTRLPVVAAGVRTNAVDGTDLVATNEEQSGMIATEHLLQFGHSVIGHLTGSRGAGRARRDGYIAAMRRAGQTPRIAGEAGTTEADGYNAAQLLLRKTPTITAIFASNDVMAMGAIAAIREHGGVVPRDVSVVGCDDSPLASSPLLQLTSVDVRSDQVGRRAAELLLRRIDGEQVEHPTAVWLNPALVARRTTAPLCAP